MRSSYGQDKWSMIMMVKFIFLFLLGMIPLHLLVAAVNPELLRKEIDQRLLRVQEFALLKDIVSKRPQANLYLFGGTAAAFAHYVRWDVEREQQRAPYFDSRFDYDLSSIYKSNQDLDLVIDAPDSETFAEIKAEIESYLKEAAAVYKLDIRPLSDFKENEDFLRQNNDTNSIGLINMRGGENVVTDVKKGSLFLNDVAKGSIHYLYDPKNHQTTSRFKEGINPPIISAIRLLNKAIQYDLEIPTESINSLKEVIDSFIPEAAVNQYVAYWINKNGLKLTQNAQDLEKAYELLEHLKLKEKLKHYGDITGDNGQHDLALWMNKEPLRSQKRSLEKFPCPQSNRASELFKNQFPQESPIILSHETNSFDAYASITNSRLGLPNAFISRDRYAGERAAYGDGLYTKLGLQGGTGSGITIRFSLHPNACEGSDFKVVGSGILVLNRDAISLLQEDTAIDIKDFIMQKIQNKEVFDHTNLAFNYKAMKRALSNINNKIFQASDLNQDMFWSFYFNAQTPDAVTLLDLLASSLLSSNPGNSSLPDLNRILRSAISKGMEKSIEAILSTYKDQIDLNKEDSLDGGHHQTLLSFAIEKNQEQLALQLIRAGANRNQGIIDSQGRPTDLLNMAIKNHMNQLVDFLLSDQSIDINKLDPARRSPFENAFFILKDDALAIKLMQSGAALPPLFSINNNALLFAFQNGMDRMKDAIIKIKKIELNQLDASKRSLLGTALDQRLETMAIKLIEAGVDLNTGIIDGSSPTDILNFAAKSNMPQVVDLLLKKPKIDLNKLDPFKRSPLGNAIELEREAIALQLIQAGANRQKGFIDSQGHSIDALNLAIQKEMIPVVDLILSKKLKKDLLHLDHSKRSPLGNALFYGHESIALALIQAGADLHYGILDKHGKKIDILRFASDKGMAQVVQLLQNRSSNLSQKEHHQNPFFALAELLKSKQHHPVHCP
ncbi:MAG: hypothetical protein HQK52_13520 [Oligoflexia bacterium]|nr:hypothetical protein [Oligoflexia bacterium]